MTARPIPRTQPRPRVRVIAGSGRNRPRIAPWLLFTLLAVLTFFALIYSRTVLSDAAFRLEEVEQRIAEEQVRYQQLRLEIARLQSPERIDPLARQLGLVLPDEVRTLEVPGLAVTDEGAEEHWANVKSILTASP